MKKVILDTNFLLLPGQHRIDVFEEIDRLVKDRYELCVVPGTLDELKGLSQGDSRDAQAAKLGFVLAQQKGLKTTGKSNDSVDDAIVDIAGKDVIVATQDKLLKKRVQEKGAKVMTMRQKQHLVLV
ncbi:PIN domain-containing protein [Nanoarchaeota archaeon]